MTMDEMERRKEKRRQSRKKGKASRSEASTSEAARSEEPIPMEDLQSGRDTSRPHSPSDVQRRSGAQQRRASVSVDPRRINTATVRVRSESARFSSRTTSIGEGSGEGNREIRDKGIAGKIRGFFSKRRNKK